MRDVFDAIKYKSYLPGAIPAPMTAAAAFTHPTVPFGNMDLSGAPKGPQNVSRKRSYNDRGDGLSQDGQNLQYGVGDMNGRSFKQPRRGGNMGRGGRYEGHGRGGQQNQQAISMLGFPQMPNPPPGIPSFDPNNPMAAMMAMQAMGFPVPGLPDLSQAASPGHPIDTTPKFQQSGYRVPRCRDYDTKGFCARGNSCKFEHGNDSIYVSPAADGK